MTLTLTFEKRDPKQAKQKALRRAGKLPAVFYGRKTPATSISVSLAEFQKVWKAAGESGVVILRSPEGELEALIHDSDRDPIDGTVRHVDFYVFEKGQKIRVRVPIEFTGVASAVKEHGGVLVKVLRELEIEAEPKNLPHLIEVDVSPLVTFESVIVAKQIALPRGVALVVLPDEVVASVYQPKEEVVPEAAPDISQIEVVKKGKEAAEGETATTAAAGGEKVPAPAPAAPASEKGKSQEQGKKPGK